jgi:hypothetical protein
VSECDREASTMRRSWPTRGCCTIGKENNIRAIVLTRTDGICKTYGECEKEVDCDGVNVNQNSMK